MQATLECKQCGGQLTPEEGQKIIYCKFCGSANVISVADRFGLYNRANYLRRQNEFDRAIGIYEDIIKEDPSDAEAYYGMALCKYGIEYVDDPKTLQKVPTCHRMRLTYISQDADFRKAIEYADPDTADLYEQEARKIDDILKKIQQISFKQEKYDIFICYKEGDGNGGRTATSVVAQDIYDNLIGQGYRVFFARKTLESKLGNEYEPIIFSALYSSKIMLVVGTSPDEFQAIWVRNEWIRYVERISDGDDCTLIPLYQNMSPYDLPDEMSNLQALDMSKIGFMQDLLDGINKLIRKSVKNKEELSMQNFDSGNSSALRKRAFLFLEQGDFESADQYFERTLDQNPEDSEAYWGKLLCDLGCRSEETLEKVNFSIKDLQNYQMALRFANEDQEQKYKKYCDYIESKLWEEEQRRKEEEERRREEEERRREENERIRQIKEQEKKKNVKKAISSMIKIIKLSVLVVSIFVLYIFVLQFIIVGVGKNILMKTGNYISAHNLSAFMESFSWTESLKKVPLYDWIYDNCEKEIDYYEKIKAWEFHPEGGDRDKYHWVSGGDYYFDVGLIDDKLEFSYCGTWYKLIDYLFAKQLYEISENGKAIRNIYADSSELNLYVLYEDGNIDIVRAYSYKAFPWSRINGWEYVYSDKSYVIVNQDYDLKACENWSNIEELKQTGNYLCGLTKDGEILIEQISNSEEFCEMDENISEIDWDQIDNMMDSLK